MRKTDLCFIVRWHPEVKIGGIELQAYLLSKGLSQQGWTIWFLTQNRVNKVEVCNRVVTIKVSSPEKLLFSLISFPKLYKWLKKVDAPIYVQFGAMPHTALVSFYAKRHSRFFVWVCGGDMDVTTTRFYSYYSLKGFFIKRIMNRVFGYFLNKLYIYGIKNADRVIVITEDQRIKLERNFKIQGITIPVAHPVPTLQQNVRDDPPLILWISNIKTLKQPELFVELATRLVDVNANFKMIGFPQEQKVLEKVKSMSKGLLNFQYVGGLTLEEVNKLLERAYILVNTSITEGLPNVFIQAWMRGTPVISLNVDPDDIIKSHDLGFHSKSMDQLEKDIRKILKDPVLWKKMSRNAYEFAKKQFSLESAIESYSKIFQKLLKKNGK